MSSLKPPAIQRLLEEGDELWLETESERFEGELDKVVYMPSNNAFRFWMKDESTLRGNPFTYDPERNIDLSVGYQGNDVDLLSLEDDYLEEISNGKDLEEYNLEGYQV